MNQGIPLSWGCTGNALSNQRSIDNEDKALPDQSGKGKKLSQSGISMVFQFFARVYCNSLQISTNQIGDIHETVLNTGILKYGSVHYLQMPIFLSLYAVDARMTKPNTVCLLLLLFMGTKL